jgi:hypothetical protein
MICKFNFVFRNVCVKAGGMNKETVADCIAELPLSKGYEIEGTDGDKTGLFSFMLSTKIL